MAKNIQVTQKELMVDYMQQNYKFLFGKFASSQGKHNKDVKWNQLCVSLNAAGPPTKTMEKWKSVIAFL